MSDTSKNTLRGEIKEFQRKFGRNLAVIRKDKGMTQEQLAHALKMDTVSVAYIEGAQRNPSFSTILKLSKALKIRPAKLFQF